MSNRAQSWAGCQRTGSPTRKLVLMLLADLADEQHTCYPGREYLADRAELSPRAVSTALTALASAGLIRVLRRARTNGGRRSNRYLLMVLGADTPLPDVADWSGEFAPVDLAEPQPAGSPAGGDPAPDAGQGNREAGSPLPPGGAGGGGNGEPGSPPTGHEVPPSHKEERSAREVPPPPDPPGAAASSAAVLPAEEEGVGDPFPEAARVIDAATAGLPADRVPRPRQAADLTRLAAEALTAGWSPDALLAALTAGSLYGAQSVYAVLRYRLSDLGPPPPQRHVQPTAAVFLAPRGVWCGEAGCDPTTRQRLDEDGRPLRAAGGGFVHCACRESQHE